MDCGYTLEPPRRGGSNEYPQSMFWSKNKKNRYTPANPSFTISKWGSRGYTLHGHVFLMRDFLSGQTKTRLSSHTIYNVDRSLKFRVSERRGIVLSIERKQMCWSAVQYPHLRFAYACCCFLCGYNK